MEEGEEKDKNDTKRKAQENAAKARQESRDNINKLKEEKEGANKTRQKMLVERIKDAEAKHNKEHGYDNPDDAARGAATQIGGLSKKSGREVGGKIYYDPKTESYHYTKGAYNYYGPGDNANTGTVPKGTYDAGNYHSHTKTNEFSGHDSDGYLITADGGLKKKFGRSSSEVDPAGTYFDPKVKFGDDITKKEWSRAQQEHARRFPDGSRMPPTSKPKPSAYYPKTHPRAGQLKDKKDMPKY